MSVQNRRKFDSDFKRNAVLLSLDPERSAARAAENPGISKELLYRWCKEYRQREELAFPGHGREALTPQEQKIRDLEKELKDVAMERDILKRPWASSAEHPNEISLRRESPLIIPGEEDVPCSTGFTERVLPLA